MGQLKHWLELNTLVLCGSDPARRAAYAGHREATERRFYGTAGAGIQDVVEWYERHRGESVWSRAAGVYVRVVSKLQLFIEGNHRTGSLVMGYLLLRDASPVRAVRRQRGRLLRSLVAAERQPQGQCRHAPPSPWLRRRLAALLRAQADPRYLRAST